MKISLPAGFKILVQVKLVAAIILLLLLYLPYSGMDLNIPYFLLPLPFCYALSWNTYYQFKITILIIPILINIALWWPCYPSYIFLRTVLYAEQIKLSVIAIVGLATFLFTPPYSIYMIFQAEVFILFIALILFFRFNKRMLASLSLEATQSFFHVDGQSKDKIRSSTQKYMTLFLPAVILLMFLEMPLQLNMAKNFVQVETIELVYNNPQNTAFQVSSYNPKTPYYVPNGSQLSVDGKKLLLRVRARDYYNNNDLFVYNIDNMNNTQILPTQRLSKSNSKGESVYAITSNSKYAIVGTDFNKGTYIKFQVFDLATGNLDNGFSDPNKLLSNSQRARIISVNPYNSYFAVVSSNLLEIWDHKTKQPLVVTVTPGFAKHFTWISDKKFLACYQDSESIGVFTSSLYEIMPNASIVQVNKNNISQKPSQSNKYSTLKSSANGKYIASCYYSGSLYTIDIYLLDSAEKIRSIKRHNPIQDIAFHPDNKNLIILEASANGNGTVALWDITKNEGLRELKLPKLSLPWEYQTYEYSDKIKFLDNGQKIILVGNSVHIIPIQ